MRPDDVEVAISYIFSSGMVFWGLIRQVVREIRVGVSYMLWIQNASHR